MIQAIMLIALGFLIASFFGVLLAPSLWSRASRLSKKRLESTLPLSLTEIEAAKDQLRATYAVRVRRLESALASAKQKAANQLVENSRLHIQIVALKDQIAELDLKLAERCNAALVLEQTITQRFPDLDREIMRVKAEVQEKSIHIRDLSSKLDRRDEELAAAKAAASSYQEELQRLHQVLEKSSADRSGRRVRRASQWDLDDYRAEYDRLNLELSKLRQQLVLFQDRDWQQSDVIKGELQKLADLIISSANHDSDSEGGIVAVGKRALGANVRRERPVPWQPEPSPRQVDEHPKVNGHARASESHARPIANKTRPENRELPPPAAIKPNGSALVAKVFSPVPEAAAEIVQQEERLEISQSGAHKNEPPLLLSNDASEHRLPTDNGLSALGEDRSAGDDGKGSPASAALAAQDRESSPPLLPNATDVRIQSENATTGSTEATQAQDKNDDALPKEDSIEGRSFADAIDLASLEPDPEEKIGPHLPTLIERLRSISDEGAESEKSPPTHRLG